MHILEEFVNEQIVLAPVCLESILLYHKLIKEGINIVCFFDQNVMLAGRTYQSHHIRNPYYSSKYKVILCNARYDVEMRKQYVELGYCIEDLISATTVTSSYKDVEIAADVSLNEYIQIKPEQTKTSAYLSEYIQLRKMKRLYELDKKCPLSKEQLSGFSVVEAYTDWQGNKLVIPMRVELIVTNRCTLKCEHCSAWMQYFQNPMNTDLKTILETYNLLLSQIDWTDELVIMGGEPFLHLELSEIIKGVAENPITQTKVGHLVLITNGTIVPKQEVLETIKKYNVNVWISNYKEQSVNLDKLVPELDKNSIDYIVMDIKWWSNVMRLITGDEEKENKSLLNRKRCITRCRTVKDGRFYLCSVIKSACDLNAVPNDEKNYVELDSENARNGLYDYLSSNRELPPACAWCSGCSEEDWNNSLIIPAEQIVQPLRYKRYNE